MQLDDFVIQIGGTADEGHPTRVLASPAGEGLGRFVPPPQSSTRLVLAAHRSRDASPTVQRKAVRRDESAPIHESPVEAGDALFRRLFAGQVGRLFDRSLGGLNGEQAGLRLKIKIDPADPDVAPLQALPWELLYRTETNEFLGLSRRSPVIRYLDVPQPVRKLPLPKPLRVLALTASPRDLEPLELEQEVDRLHKAEKGTRRVRVDVLRHATVDRLRQRLLADEVHVLHFMGHGGHDPTSGAGVLFFEDERGLQNPVSGHALAMKLQDVRSLALVFLNACHTAGVGRQDAAAFSDVASALVRGGMPAVVAMRQAISDAAAIAFSATFYRRLAEGDAVDLALTEGRQAVHSAAPDGFEWSIPILFARVPSGDLFLQPATSRRAAGWAVAAVLTLGALGGPWVYQQVTTTESVFALDHVFASDQEGVSGRVEMVEILADGRMRIYFSFANDTAEAKKIGLDLEQTYLADEDGNAYEVLDWSAPVDGAERIVEAVPPGESTRHWIEVNAPQQKTRRMGVALAGADKADVSFPYFEVELPDAPREATPTTTERQLPPESDVVDLQTELATGVRGLDANVSQVAMVADRAMRWSVDVFNRAGRDLGIGLVPAGFELVDDLGNVYRPLGHGLWQNPGKFWDGIRLPNALKVGYWLDFPPPKPGASKFTLRLATREESEVSFEPAKVELDEAVERLYEKYPMLNPVPEPIELKPRQPPPPPHPPAEEPQAETLEEPTPPVVEQPVATFDLADGEKELISSHDGLRAKLSAIDRLGNGRMRWHIQFVNESASPVRFGIDFARTALSAGRLSYRLERSSTSSDSAPTQAAVSLPPGGESRIWIEFAGRAQSMDDLMVLTLGGDGDVRFRPLMVRMSDVRASD